MTIGPPIGSPNTIEMGTGRQDPPEKWIGKKTQEADQSSEARFAGMSDLQQLPDWVQILHICGGRTGLRSGRLTPESRRFSTRPIGPALALIHREDEGAGRCFGRFV